jgi:mannosyltransferase OCH1-like enzyme
MNSIKILIANRTIRLIGNFFKVLSYPFHMLLPKVRFTIPEYSKAKIKLVNTSPIPKTIWQTNYSNRSSLPIYLNYLFNRLMSLDYDYRYVSTEEREIFMLENTPDYVYQAYKKINDGAAQADLWRVCVLYIHGGVYIDIDATLVWPLRLLIRGENKSIYLKIKNFTRLTNYFLATTPKMSDYDEIINLIVKNINNYDKEGVYTTTGPDTFTAVLEGRTYYARREKYTCIQGAFTNEYFQYIDKPRGKWTHMNPEDLIK